MDTKNLNVPVGSQPFPYPASPQPQEPKEEKPPIIHHNWMSIVSPFQRDGKPSWPIVALIAIVCTMILGIMLWTMQPQTPAAIAGNGASLEGPVGTHGYVTAGPRGLLIGTASTSAEAISDMTKSNNALYQTVVVTASDSMRKEAY
jgi:hypothetical protein